ncbi:uncharacterized protein VP01_3573g1 [Puccinia sorghi]|uniref:Uncharacterized protein n=1 Tax=Puccinia sorghi TaxID=27349 RepID=A0A0L6UV88_9BASI|nr:uncharacterized protein VP01_3573g1 [Puccinia sorghi]
MADSNRRHQFSTLVYKKGKKKEDCTQKRLVGPNSEQISDLYSLNGACVLIDNCFQLLGSFKNNLLEIQSSHIEVIKSNSACYQALMVPNSEIVNCDICKSCKLKTQPFGGKFKVAKDILSSFHIDLVGPFPVQSPGGFVYFLSLIDQCSGF